MTAEDLTRVRITIRRNERKIAPFVRPAPRAALPTHPAPFVGMDPKALDHVMDTAERRAAADPPAGGVIDDE